MEYQEYDLKVQRCKIDEITKKIFFILSREDSLERLFESDKQFKDDNINIEEQVINSIMVAKLSEALKLLTKPEQELLQALFFDGKSELAWSAETGVSQQAISYRKQKILKKLKKLLKN